MTKDPDLESGAAHDRKQPEPEGDSEPVWTYRGYELHPEEFATAMVHLFRGEVARANVWRQRLDVTTNWAVIATGAAISVAFTKGSPGHIVIILNTLLITFLLYIEARRYRYYELWSYRVRLMETDFYAGMLVPPFRPAPDWAETLAENLLHPHFPISLWEALGRRLRRNFIWIYLVLGISWGLQIWLYPSAAETWTEFTQRAAVGGIPGGLVLIVGISFNAVLMAFALLTIGLQEATGEVLPRFGGEPTSVERKDLKEEKEAWFRPSRRRRQFIAMIITDAEQAVSDRILKDMHRGVTAMQGVGKYTDREHSVLLCALTITEIAQLKALVKEEDPEAFVVVSPAREVLGTGFEPLTRKAE
jgi:uncharacterized membrane protein